MNSVLTGLGVECLDIISYLHLQGVTAVKATFLIEIILIVSG